jgi:hypothetical protein
MAGKALNLAASVHQRLLNRAKASFHPFGGLLQHFAIERFLYRLSRSRHVDRFILKGALMLPIWSGVASRGRRPNWPATPGKARSPRSCRPWSSSGF